MRDGIYNRARSEEGPIELRLVNTQIQKYEQGGRFLRFTLPRVAPWTWRDLPRNGGIDLNASAILRVVGESEESVGVCGGLGR